MKKYNIEIFFWKDQNIKRAMDTVPVWKDYQEETKKIEFETWEDPRNETLRLYPGTAFLIIRGIKNIGVDREKERFLSEYDTELLEIKPSKIHGNGVYSKRPIIRNFSVFSLYGEMISSKDIKGDFPEGEWNAISDTQFLVRKKRTLYGYINHSRTPNCEIDFSSMEVKTISGIRKGEELTLDYRKEALPESYKEKYGALYL